METFYFIFAFVIVLSFYAFSIRLRKDYVIAVDSQSTKSLTSEELKQRSYFVKHRIYKDENGCIIKPNTVIHAIVLGSSMRPKIMSGDRILVIKLNKKKKLEEQIEINDILLLYSEDTDTYKLRAFKEFEGDVIITYYKNQNDKEMIDFLPSSVKILGIAKYNIGNDLVPNQNLSNDEVNEQMQEYLSDNNLSESENKYSSFISRLYESLKKQAQNQENADNQDGTKSRSTGN